MDKPTSFTKIVAASSQALQILVQTKELALTLIMNLKCNHTEQQLLSTRARYKASFFSTVICLRIFVFLNIFANKCIFSNTETFLL